MSILLFFLQWFCLCFSILYYFFVVIKVLHCFSMLHCFLLFVLFLIIIYDSCCFNKTPYHSFCCHWNVPLKCCAINVLCFFLSLLTWWMSCWVSGSVDMFWWLSFVVWVLHIEHERPEFTIIVNQFFWCWHASIASFHLQSLSYCAFWLLCFSCFNKTPYYCFCHHWNVALKILCHPFFFFFLLLSTWWMSC